MSFFLFFIIISLLYGWFVRYSKGNKSDQAHPPIHPTKPATNLTDEEQRKVYELITRHFLACCWADAIGAEETVDIEINEEKFHAKGLRIIEKNYLEVYKYDSWGEKQLPQFVQDECFILILS